MISPQSTLDRHLNEIKVVVVVFFSLFDEKNGANELRWQKAEEKWEN